MISIDRIEIKNFRQYRNVELNFDKNTGSYFFVGKNGIGKSNFMNAICWCLYGRIPFRSDSDKTSAVTNIVNLDAQRSGEKEVEVKIAATIAGKKYLISRDSTVNLVLNPYLKNQSNFSVFEIKEHDLIPQENPEITIEQLLPFDLSNLFIFDGEVIKNLFDGDYSEKLKNQVYKVSNIDILKRAKDDVEKVIKIYEKQRKARSSDQERKLFLEQNMATNEEKIEDLKNQIADLLNQRGEIEQKQTDLLNKLSQYTSVKEKVDERERLIKEIQTIIKKKEEKQKQINELIQKNVSFAMTKKQMSDYLDAINAAVKRGEVPPAISTTALEDIIKTRKCICHRDLDANSENAIKDLLKENEQIDELSYLQDHNYGCSRKMRDFAAVEKELNTYEKELEDFEIDLEKKDKRLHVVVDEIQKTPAFAAITKNNPRDELNDIQHALTKIDGDIAIKERDRNNFIAENEENDKELSSLMDNSRENKIIHAKIVKLTSISRTIDAIQRQILTNTKEKIERGTTETYKKLHWKEEVTKVTLSDDYSLTIQKTNGESTSLQDLSNGEKKMLGISLINALSKKLKNFDFPFFIDSPTEELDTSVVPKVLDNLQALSSDKQVFIMTLNKPEITTFLDTIPNDRKYSLIRDNTNGIDTTSIAKERTM